MPRSTIQSWIKPSYVPIGRTTRTALHLERVPRPPYSYLLGLYLGDGSISRHDKGVFALRIYMDARYSDIIEACRAAIEAVLPESRVSIGRLPSRAVTIGSYSKAWPLFFPQHGPGRKHERKIELAPWQQEIVDEHPRELLRGLIHSDGCRVLNRVNGKDYPRYFFSQVSDDIREIFCATCDRLDISWRKNKWNSISVARAPRGAFMDTFIGPKS